MPFASSPERVETEHEPGAVVCVEEVCPAAPELVEPDVLEPELLEPKLLLCGVVPDAAGSARKNCSAEKAKAELEKTRIRKMNPARKPLKKSLFELIKSLL